MVWLCAGVAIWAKGEKFVGNYLTWGFSYLTASWADRGGLLTKRTNPGLTRGAGGLGAIETQRAFTKLLRCHLRLSFLDISTLIQKTVHQKLAA